MAQIIRLECTTGGHNKFYKMTENGDGTFTARYGANGQFLSNADKNLSDEQMAQHLQREDS